MRIVVIGGGIAGASAAYWLSEGAEVTLVEAEALCGYHTTGRSAALLTEAWEHGVPAMLASGSRPFLEDPPDGFADIPLLTPLPVAIVGTDGEAVATLADAAAERTEVFVLDAGGLADLCPVIDTAVVTSGVLEPGGREIDVAALHQGFLRGASQRGADIVTGARVETLTRRDGGWRVGVRDSTLEAQVIVNAAGAWCDEVAELAGVTPLGLQPMRRTAFTFEPEHDTSSWPMVIDVHEDYYFKPERTQVMGSLSEEHPMPPHDVRPEEIDVALAIDRIQHATTLEIRHVKRTWAGLRTFSPDRDPVNGFDPVVPGFYWLAGQGGFGIMTSPAMGRIAAGMILHGSLPDDLAASGLTAEMLSPNRFR
ncbi:MAG: FAD-binding oxidoreductase [Acidimicrobiia bacterium]|nr:FAD-binding oxidoreductase [Acidimicrobiia bacterium]